MSRSTIRAVASMRSRVRRCGTSASGTWIVTGTTASSGDQIIITGFAGAPQRAREFAQEFGVAGMAESRVVKRLLGDRIGDHARARRRFAHSRQRARSIRGSLARRRDRACRARRRRVGERARRAARVRKDFGRALAASSTSIGVSSPSARLSRAQGAGIGREEERRAEVRALAPGATERAPGRCRRDRPSSGRWGRRSLDPRRALDVAERAQVDLRTGTSDRASPAARPRRGWC